MNVCLGREFTGGQLYFRGVRYSVFHAHVYNNLKWSGLAGEPAKHMVIHVNTVRNLENFHFPAVMKCSLASHSGVEATINHKYFEFII